MPGGPSDLPSVRIVLVRHGQAGDDQPRYGPETPLTQLGRTQAEALAGALRDEGVTRIVSSPFARARQTAQPTAELLGLEIAEDERLIEFQLGGEDVPVETMVEERRDLMLWRPHDQLDGAGETLRAFQGRVSAALDELVAEHVCERVAVVTHAGTIAAAMRWVYGLTPEHDWHSDIEVFNASITEAQHWPSGRHPAGAPFA